MGDMTKPVTKSETIVTDDGVPIDTAHLAGDSELAIVLAHGFTQSWQRHAVWAAATRLNRAGGVVLFDFRGHGRSGGQSTLGDRRSGMWPSPSPTPASWATSASPPSVSRWARR